MMSWQKRARIAVAIVGVVSAIAVYVSFSGRRTAAVRTPIERSDPAAVAETSGSELARFGGVDKSFEITGAERTLSYPDGSFKTLNFVARVPKGPDRTVTISAAEATGVSRSDDNISLSGSVRLEDSDGFHLTTDRATWNGKTAVAEADGAVTFGKGRMSGSGTAMLYDVNRDVLEVKQQAQVTSTDERGAPVMQFSAGSAMFDRLQHRLTVATSVHVVRDSQIIDTDWAEARLTDDNDVVTSLQLRGNSRVSGGEARIERMRARDIDLDYTDDGETLEAVTLVGDAAIAQTGTAGRPGLQIQGKDLVDLDLAADGSLTRVVGRDNVRLDLPAADGTPMRSIRAESLEASGEPGRGLTRATFTRNVAYTEQAAAGARTATAGALETQLANDAVTAATFTGDVVFEEVGLKACAGRLDYEPEKGTLRLSGATRDGSPMVAEEQVTVEGQTIDVALETRRMTADGTSKAPVKAVLQSTARRCTPSQGRPSEERGASRMPRLLDRKSEVTVQGPHLEYDSRTGTAGFSGGRSTLRQGETSIAAADLLIDQGKGNLTATGDAFSTLLVDGTRTVGRANEIRYTDEDRRVRFIAAARNANARAPVAASETAAASQRAEATLTSDGSLLRAAEYVELRLARDDNTVERMQAEGGVHVVDGNHTVTGGARLDYDGSSERYDVTAPRGRQVTVAIRHQDGACRASYGRVVRFHKGREGVTIDGRGVQDVSTGPSDSACALATR